jgi:hypothetical protein
MSSFVKIIAVHI